ncbi:hypothetical protein [Actinomadura soli]|nr:hypothetical protein [Actinomadura soli]
MRNTAGAEVALSIARIPEEVPVFESLSWEVAVVVMSTGSGALW